MKSEKYYVVDMSGAILRSVKCTAADAGLQPGVGEFVVKGGACDINEWFDQSIMESRLRTQFPVAITGLSILADGQDAAVISPIPAGVFVTWPDGQRDEVLDGQLEYSAEDVGTHKLILDGVQYLPMEVTIEAYD